MAASANSSQQWNSRKRVKVGVVVALVGFTLIVALLVDESGGGSQIAESPNGKYSLEVMRHSSSWRTIPYTVNLRDFETGKLIRKYKIDPVDGKPTQQLPESSRTIAWDEFSRFADVVLDGEYVCRVYVPSQQATILMIAPIAPAK